MSVVLHRRGAALSRAALSRAALSLATLAIVAACATPPAATPPAPANRQSDARVGLSAGLFNAGEAVSNMRVVGTARSPEGFLGIMNSDLAFTGNYVIQGNYTGPVIWDISNPAAPTLVKAIVCPASQNDVSVFRNLMFVSSEDFASRTDCGSGGVRDSVSAVRFRGVRVFDISNIADPKLLVNVQTCRGSHTHTVLEDPKDKANVYIYVSGSAPVRSPNELAGCVSADPNENASSSLLRIEVIKVPLAHPEQAAIVNRANIFTGLTVVPEHYETPAERRVEAQRADSARRAGGFAGKNPISGVDIVIGPRFTRAQLDSLVRVRGGTGAPTAADSTKLRAELQTILNRLFGEAPAPGTPISAGNQCHDITVYPAIGLAGGACEGHGLLLDISDPVNPIRLDAVADSNFAYWHSATFNNDGTKLLFSDEWGGGGAPKCRDTDLQEWGADAIFTIENRRLRFHSYYKIPTVQTAAENCVAHNGSLIPIPGRDVMVQAWYQGGISVFDWTDADKPFEIAFFDRGPVTAERMEMGGSWSVYWYNGNIVSSEIARGLDVAQLTPSEHLTQNEIDAANTVRWTELNAQGQPKISWPPSFALAKAFLDQAERKQCLAPARVSALRTSIAAAERATGPARATALNGIAGGLAADAASACDGNKNGKLRKALTDLANAPIS